MTEFTGDEPVLAQNEATDEDRLRGLVAQLVADLAGEDAATVDTAVRRRLDDTGIALTEQQIAVIVEEIARAQPL